MGPSQSTIWFDHCHQLEPWLMEGMAYVLFGFGSHTGSLGIRNTAVFGPENGLLGLGLNLLFARVLWRLWQKRDEN